MKYTIEQIIDPLTFQPKIGILLEGKPFLVMNIEMAKDEDHRPFSKKENFENDWKELGEFIKNYFEI